MRACTLAKSNITFRITLFSTQLRISVPMNVWIHHSGSICAIQMSARVKNQVQVCLLNVQWCIQTNESVWEYEFVLVANKYEYCCPANILYGITHVAYYVLWRCSSSTCVLYLFVCFHTLHCILKSIGWWRWRWTRAMSRLHRIPWFG